MSIGADRQRAVRAGRIAVGVCIDCEGELGHLSTVRCDSCYRKKKYQDHRFREGRRSSGVCLKCGSVDVVTDGRSLRCIDCYMKCSASKIRSRTGSDLSWKTIKKIWVLQGGVCAITGVRLTPGLDAQLDHIIPVSRCSDPNGEENLRWVHYRVNHAKYDMTDSEFVEFVDDLHRCLHKSDSEKQG